VGYVAQAPFILDGTLRENIAFGVDEGAVDRTRLDEAIEAAHLRPLMRELPHGLDTELGERGVRLSGGQRQRVAIARALYRDVDILILDEATSALDSLSEREVTEAIARLAGKLTIVVIAHRLATVTHCGEIWVLDQGRVVGVGDHTGLLESCPLYRRLVEAQFGAIADAANHRKPRGVARA
jgi:HlyD family secretion protein